MGGGWGIFEPKEFFSLSNSMYEFFLGSSMNIFSFNFSLCEYIFCTSPPSNCRGTATRLFEGIVQVTKKKISLFQFIFREQAFISTVQCHHKSFEDFSVRKTVRVDSSSLEWKSRQKEKMLINTHEKRPTL